MVEFTRRIHNMYVCACKWALQRHGCSMSILTEKMFFHAFGEKSNLLMVWTLSPVHETPAMKPFVTMGQMGQRIETDHPVSSFSKECAFLGKEKKSCTFVILKTPKLTGSYPNAAKNFFQRVEMSPKDFPFLETHRPTMFAPHRSHQYGVWLSIVPGLLSENHG